MYHPDENTVDPDVGRPLANVRLGDRVAELRYALEKMGLSKSDYMGSVMYKGGVANRDVTVTVMARSRSRFITPEISRRVYDGLSLEVQVASRIDAYLMMAPLPLKMPWLVGLLQRFNRARRMEALPASYEPWSIWARDLDWGSRFLSRSTVQRCLSESPLGGAGRMPFTMYWKTRTCGAISSDLPSKIGGEWCQRLVNDVYRLAEESECGLFSAPSIAKHV